MKKDFNWTLCPFIAGGLVFSAALCVRGGWRGAPLAGMFLLLTLAGMAALAVLYVLVLWIAGLPVKRGEPQRTYLPFYHRIIIYTMGLCCAFFRIKITVSGAERLPEGRWLLVGNHRSSFDPLITGWALRWRPLSFVMKPVISRLPVIGPFIHAACFLSIDRENDRAALKTILEAAGLLKEGVVSVGIYPEGTRNRGEGLLPLRNGAFKIAQRAKAPIVVARLTGTDAIFRHYPWRRTPVHLEIRKVLTPEALAGINTVEIGEEVCKWLTYENT